MKHKRCHFLFVTLLAAAMSIALSLSAVQSSTMDIMMSMSSDMSTMDMDAMDMDAMDMGAMDKAPCDGCPEGDDGVAAACSSICMIMAFATLPQALDLVRTVQGDRFEVSPVTPRDGPSSTEPNPPKHHNFS